MRIVQGTGCIPETERSENTVEEYAMKRELGIARCGLACCLCSENVTCAGCSECNESCRKGLLQKIKPYAFNLFIKRYGKDALLDCLEQNEKKGVVYHRSGVNGDYDDFTDVEKLIAFIRTGNKEA